MNRYLLRGAIALVAVLMLGAQAQAASISTTWKPTDGNVNIIRTQGGKPAMNGGVLALFEAAGDFSGPALVLGSIGGTFEFTDNMDTTFTVEGFVNGASVGSINMVGDEFMFGVSWDGGPWQRDLATRIALGDPTTWASAFRYRGDTAVVLAADLTPVPLPAAALLFASALIGLAGVKRRKI